MDASGRFGIRALQRCRTVKGRIQKNPKAGAARTAVNRASLWLRVGGLDGTRSGTWRKMGSRAIERALGDATQCTGLWK